MTDSDHSTNSHCVSSFQIATALPRQPSPDPSVVGIFPFTAPSHSFFAPCRISIAACGIHYAHTFLPAAPRSSLSATSCEKKHLQRSLSAHLQPAKTQSAPSRLSTTVPPEKTHITGTESAGITAPDTRVTPPTTLPTPPTTSATASATASAQASVAPASLDDQDQANQNNQDDEMKRQMKDRDDSRNVRQRPWPADFVRPTTDEPTSASPSTSVNASLPVPSISSPPPSRLPVRVSTSERPIRKPQAMTRRSVSTSTTTSVSRQKEHHGNDPVGDTSTSAVPLSTVPMTTTSKIALPKPSPFKPSTSTSASSTLTSSSSLPSSEPVSSAPVSSEPTSPPNQAPQSPETQPTLPPMPTTPPPAVPARGASSSSSRVARVTKVTPKAKDKMALKKDRKKNERKSASSSSSSAASSSTSRAAPEQDEDSSESNVASEDEEMEIVSISPQERRRRQEKRQEQIKRYRAREQREERNARLIERRKLTAGKRKNEPQAPVTDLPAAPPKKKVIFNLKKNQTRLFTENDLVTDLTISL